MRIDRRLLSTLPLLLLVLPISCAPLLADDLVTITLAGTKIDVLPIQLDVIVAHPAKEVKGLIERGGRKNEGIPNSVYFRGVLHIFATPHDWNKRIKGHLYREGDVVYCFLLKSKEAGRKFVERYELKKHATIDGRGKTKTLYSASVQRYVIILLKTTIYSCPLHPAGHFVKPGICPKCGLKLVETTAYE